MTVAVNALSAGYHSVLKCGKQTGIGQQCIIVVALHKLTHEPIIELVGDNRIEPDCGK